MPRHQGKRRALHTGRYGSARALLGPRPCQPREAKQDGLQGRQEQAQPGALLHKSAPRRPHRSRALGRASHGPGGGSQPAHKHAPESHRAGEEDEGARGAGRAPGGPRRSAKGKEGGVSKKGLQRHYDRPTPEERFRLDVLATAREDLQESERLVSSCPRFSYTMNEMGFVERWRSAIEITLRIYVPLGEQLAKLQMIGAFRIFVPYSQTLLTDASLGAYYRGHEAGSRHAWAYAGKGGAPPAWPKDGPEGEIGEPEEEEQDPAMEREADELEAVAKQYNGFFPDVLDELERRCVREALSIWTGYASFCQKSAGVGAEELAAVVLAPLVEQIEDMKVRARRLGVEAEEGLVEQVREALAEAWRIVEARGA